MPVNTKPHSRLTQLLWRYGPLLLWMAIIFAASSQSSLPSADDALADKILKKFGHLAAYALMMWLILRAIAPTNTSALAPAILPVNHLSARQSLVAFAILMAYAAGDEFHQSFVSGRTASWIDVIFFDGLGGCAGWVAYQRFKHQQLKPQHAWLYWLLFLGCTALLLMLNFPYNGKAEQEPARLLNDYWFLWGFNYFGLLLMPMALLLFEDARARQMRPWVYVIPYFGVGVLALSAYLARRSRPAKGLNPGRSISVPRWLWLSLVPTTLLLSVWLLPIGSWASLSVTMHHNVGLWFMWLDIVLNHILTLPLVHSDMERRGMPTRWPWLLLFIALTGPIGLGLYMARRPETLTIHQ